jgi:hypothetical protein
VTPTTGNRFRSETSQSERVVIDVSYLQGLVTYRIHPTTSGERRKLERCTLRNWSRWCEVNKVKEVGRV